MSNTPPVPDPYDLQFDTVEPTATPSGAAATESLQAVPAGPVCAGCKQGISGTYYAIGDKPICSNCRDQVAAGPGGSRVGRLAKAIGLGIGAGLVGALIWFGVRKITGYEIGLIAILVGFMVGAAVRAGSGGRGGRGYQVVAVLLTYLAISVNYMPDLFMALMHKFEDKPRAHQTTNAAPGASKSTADDETADDATSSSTAQPTPTPKVGVGKAILLLLVALALLIGLACAMPVLVGFQNPIGLIIFGIALWEAWKINRGSSLAITGPFAFNPAAAVPTVASLRR